MSLATFDEFIAPWPARQFLQEIYGHTPAYIEGRRDRFAHLLSWDALNTILRQHRLEGLHLRFARQGQMLAAEAYTSTVPRNSGAGTLSRLNLPELTRRLQEGATLILDSIEELYEPITDLAGTLEYALGDRVRVNTYAGWQATQGFDTHWDGHDGFIVQVGGRKHWRVFAPVERHPLSSRVGLRLEPAAAPYWEGVLNSGDLLYIPRGWPHDAVPLGEPTLHLTFGVYRLTGIDLAGELINRLREQEALRADLPKFASAAEQQQYMEAFHNAIVIALQGLSLEAHLRQMDARARVRGRLSLPWSSMPQSQPIADSDWLHWLPPRQIVLREANGKVAFSAMGTQFAFESIAAPIVETLAKERRTRFDRLCAAHPLSASPTATRGSIELFIKELISQGLITISGRDLI